MQATAIGTVAVTIVLLGSFLYTRALMSHVGSQFLDQIEVSVYLSSADTAAQIGELRSRLAADPRIAQATFVPKKDGLRELRERMKGQIDLSILTENPLPDKFRVRVLSPADVAPVASEIRKWPGVDSVNYGQDLVARLLQLSKVMNNVGVAVIGLFILVAAIIISNTIRLTVFARRREISIMQLVGATNMYIRLPFICEGFLAGITGALVALAALLAARAEILPKLAAALPFVRMNDAAVDVAALALELLIVGGAVGIISSWFSVGRHLRT